MTTLSRIHNQIVADHLLGVVTNHAHTATDLESYDWDMKDSWMTINNWQKVTRTYLDPERLASFLSGEVDYLDSKDVPMVGGRALRRQWGSCLLAWTLQDNGSLYLHARTSILGFLLPLDLAITWRLARLVEADSITLFLEMSQVHPFKSIPYFLPRILRPPQIQRAIDRLEELDRQGVRYLDMKFAQECRLRRRYHTEVYGPEYGKQFEGGENYRLSVSPYAADPLPSHPAESLTFSHLGVDDE